MRLGIRRGLWLIVVSIAFVTCTNIVMSAGPPSGGDAVLIWAGMTVLSGVIAGSRWSLLTLPFAFFLVFAVPSLFFPTEAMQIGQRREGGIAFVIVMNILVMSAIVLLAWIGDMIARLIGRSLHRGTLRSQ